jgi:hypothetical protein
MSRGPVHPRAYAQIAVFLLVIVAIGAVVQIVRETAPEVTLDTITEAAPDPEDPEVVTCERTLPNAPESLEQIAEVDPVGRVSSSEVIDCPDAFDRQVVTYVGEVVGDVLRREDGAWLLVNDDAYALTVGPLQGHSNFEGTNTGLSVWLPNPLPELVPGGPDRRGTIIVVDGVIQRTDPRDGGGLTLTALSAEDTAVIAESQPVDRPLTRGQAVAAVAFSVIAAAVLFIERRAAARR